MFRVCFRAVRRPRARSRTSEVCRSWSDAQPSTTQTGRKLFEINCEIVHLRNRTIAFGKFNASDQAWMVSISVLGNGRLMSFSSMQVRPFQQFARERGRAMCDCRLDVLGTSRICIAVSTTSDCSNSRVGSLGSLSHEPCAAG